MSNENQYQNIYTHLYLRDVEQGRDTLALLKAKKSEVERGDTPFATLVNYNNIVGDIYRTHYKSICEAIAILEQNHTTSHVEQQITNILRNLDF